MTPSPDPDAGAGRPPAALSSAPASTADSPARSAPQAHEAPAWQALCEQASAAADGDAQALHAVMSALATGSAAQQSALLAQWHALHLAGDVMRSADLASDPAHDAAFLAALRTRLAREPVPLARPWPAPAAAPAGTVFARPGWAWQRPALAAASLAGVAFAVGLLMLAQGGAPGAGPQAGLQGSGATELTPAATPVAVGSAPVLRDGMQRDARLDELMRLHQSAHGGLALPRTEARPVDLQISPAGSR